MFLPSIRAGRRIAGILTVAAPLTGAFAVGGCAVAETAMPALRVEPAALVDPSAAPRATDFDAFVAGLWPEAKARGVSRATFDAAFRGVSPDPKIVALTQKQSEFSRPIWDYIDGAISKARLDRGRAMAERYASTLDALERAYGVPRSVVLGVWGMETNFGSFTGSMDVIRSLATLAHIGYRGDFFRGELLTALQILEQDHIDRAEMKGSWAGAMGHTQFMPSSFKKYAVDGDGDGKRDIWSSIPDALASTASYLKQHGWRPGLAWGYEVRVPAGFDFRVERGGFAVFARAGVKRVDGRALPTSGEARLFLPGGARGPAFLVTENFDVIKDYNASDAYAMAVAHLGDRILGGQPIQGSWPRNAPQLDASQRKEIQSRLNAMGLYDGKLDGKFGTQTREAVRAFQLRRGLLADGYADMALLEQLRRTR